MARESNITDAQNWFIGEDHTFRFDVVNDAGLPVDASSWSMEWVIKRHPKDESDFIRKTVADGQITVTGADNSEVMVDVDAADTLGQQSGRYFHTLWRTDADAQTVLSYGTAMLKQGAFS